MPALLTAAAVYFTRLQSEMHRDLGTTAGLHPFIDALGVVDNFRDGAVETEEAVGDIERVAGLGQRPHAANEIGAAASHHHIERGGAVAAEVLAQCVTHRPERLINVGVVRLPPDYEKHVGLLEP